jgi:threonine aldolase
VTSQHKSFGSDNHAGAHPEVLSALMAANAGDATSYGHDSLTERVTARLCAEFGAAGAYLVFGGTAANMLGLGLMLRPGDAVICADTAHVHTDEGGGAEQVLGCKLLTVPAPDGKLTPGLIASQLADRGNPHKAQARVVAIAQATEVGTCYTLSELRVIREFCDESGLLLYIDGARLANAAAALDCTLAELAAHADVLSFGGTKNGALGVEAVIVMRASLTAAAPFQQMQRLQLASKMRFLAAQFEALLDGALWQHNARAANAMARRLADGLAGLTGVQLAYPVQANAVFATMGRDQAAALQQDWNFHIWAGEDEPDCTVRWMMAFDTTEADVDNFAAAIRAAAAVTSPAASSPAGA